MSAFATPALVTVEPAHNLNHLITDRLAHAPGAPAVARKRDGVWEELTIDEYNAEIVAVAKGLVARGIEPNQQVGIMSRTTYEWSLLDWAIWAAGAVPVPLYETSSSEQVEWIVNDAQVRLLIAETPENAATVAKIRDKAPHLADVLVISEGAIATLIADGAEVSDEEIARRRTLAKQDSLATIIYTSGTTGRPKGAELTHQNFHALALNAIARLRPVVSDPGSRTLLFMPLAHVFARFIHVLTVPAGAVLGHSPDTKTLVADLGEFRPTFILSVPRVFEKVYNASEQKAAAGGKRGIFQRAAKTSIVYSRALDDPKGPSLWLKLQHKVADVLVLNKLRTALGGQARWAISGGAPLGDRLGHFYRGVGLSVLEGYGLTETTAPTSVNVPEKVKIGTVGPPLPGTEARIAEDGEIELRGIHIFRGYRNNPEATAEALSADGWFRTGDLGSMDEDGFLSITGRKKEIIVTAAGKNVAPAVLEDRLRGHPLVSQVVVVGDQRPFIGALITLDEEGLPGWYRAKGLEPMPISEAINDPQVRESLDRAVERTNEAVSRAESIRKYRILDLDFTIANDYLTPSLKVKKSKVLQDFAGEIDKLYVDDRENKA